MIEVKCLFDYVWGENCCYNGSCSLSLGYRQWRLNLFDFTQYELVDDYNYNLDICRPHSSQSACVRPSRLYRHSANLQHRLSMQSCSSVQSPDQLSSRLKPVPIPLSPNCDFNHNKDRFSVSGGSTAGVSGAGGILSPTGSTVSSLLSIPVFPRSSSDTSSVVTSVYSDVDSINSHHQHLSTQYTHYKCYTRYYHKL